jgi:phospholipid transport system substrate-binding protein
MKFVAGVFARYINEFSGERLEVTGSTERSATDIIVNSKVHFADGRSPLDVRWRVTKSGGSYKVFDVRVLGVWAVLQARAEFESVINQNGGTISGLLDYLQRNS